MLIWAILQEHSIISIKHGYRVNQTIFRNATSYDYRTTLVSKVSIPPTLHGIGPDDFETKPLVAYNQNFDIWEPKKESLSNNIQRFESLIQMKNIISNKDYCAKLLWNSIRPSHFNIVSTLAAPKSLMS